MPYIPIYTAFPASCKRTSFVSMMPFMESVPPSLVFNPVAIREPFAEKPSLPPSPQTAANPFLSRSRVLGHLFPCRFELMWNIKQALQQKIFKIFYAHAFLHGEMAERFNAAVLKTAVGKPTVGSNPTLSANSLSKKTYVNLDIVGDYE